MITFSSSSSSSSCSSSFSSSYELYLLLFINIFLFIRFIVISPNVMTIFFSSSSAFSSSSSSSLSWHTRTHLPHNHHSLPHKISVSIFSSISSSSSSKLSLLTSWWSIFSSFPNPHHCHPLPHHDILLLIFLIIAFPFILTSSSPLLLHHLHLFFYLIITSPPPQYSCTAIFMCHSACGLPATDSVNISPFIDTPSPYANVKLFRHPFTIAVSGDLISQLMMEGTRVYRKNTDLA